MTRKQEALNHFKVTYTDKLHEQKISEIRKYITEHQFVIEAEIIETFKELIAIIQKAEKDVVFITGSVLRASLKNGGDKFLLSAYSDIWYLDKEPIEVYYKASWFWDKLHEYQKEISAEAKKYVSKITKPDVERIKWSKIEDYKALILPIFRSSVEKVAQLQEYRDFKKSYVLDIRMGEHHDFTESIWFENTTEMSVDKIRPLLKPQNEAHTAYRHYKNLNLSKGDYSGINFAYTRFENIDFSDSNFENCALIGTKFINCNLTNTILENTILDTTYKECSTQNLSEKLKEDIAMTITKYFKIKEDRKIENKPSILGFKSSFTKAEYIDEDDNIVYVKSTGKTIEYTAYLDKTLLLVSDKFKEVAKMYNPDYIYKTVALQVEDENNQTIYWNIEMPPENKCLSPSTTFNPDGTLNKIVINNKEAESLPMFRLQNKLWNTYIINLNMAESLLRRGLVGFELEELEHE
ncbi:MAG: pentapeptide repeat-containing protein [Defluviitaleaceae bacterium]|nr:pentapeptide repeat-containing protein [Defluviitaleaceae bacterium]